MKSWCEGGTTSASASFILLTITYSSSSADYGDVVRLEL